MRFITRLRFHFIEEVTDEQSLPYHKSDLLERLHMITAFLVSLLSCIAGAICGMGGSVIIKPILDLTGLGTVSTINFLSSCTVLSMSLYSVGKSLLSHDRTVEKNAAIPLAVGAAGGGVLGKQLFQLSIRFFPSTQVVGAVQSVCLGTAVFGTLLYTLNKSKIKTRQIKEMAAALCIGLCLGVLSSFLGIGGGPINLVILYFFFSMDTKTAATNNLYIILFSQAASLLITIISGNVPDFAWPVLLIMILGGIEGGIIGRAVNKRIPARAVDKLLLVLIVLIICISIYNTIGYLK